MRFNTHLTFDGDCEAAFKLYAESLGGEIKMILRYGEAPEPTEDPALTDKVLHATLRVGDQTLTGADVPSGVYERPRGFAVQLNLDDEEAAQRLFDVFAEGGEVRVPLQKTFWAEHYGLVTDRFGTPWEINCS